MADGERGEKKGGKGGRERNGQENGLSSR